MKRSNLLALLAALFSLSLTACGAGVVEDGAADDADSNDALTNPGRFETFVGQDGRSYFHLIAANGEKVLASQGYSTEAAAEAGIGSVKTNGIDAANYQLRSAADGSPYFVLVAGNGEVIAVSELYASSSNATRAIASITKIVQATAAQPVAPATGAHFDVFKGLDGKYYFHLRAANGEIVLQSQAYSSRSSATSGVASVQTNGANASRYQLRDAADGQTYFVLKASNGKVIGLSEMYASTSDANRGEQAVIAILAPQPR